MSAWGTTDLAEALPAAPAPEASAEGAPQFNPRAHGWVQPEAYDYAKYNMSGKEYEAQKAAAAENAELGPTLHSGETWAGSAPVYEWKGEYGDVGPRFPDIEKMLFGTDEDNGTGVINFEKYLLLHPDV